MNFINGFGLYRNMYRTLIGFYFILVGITAVERQRVYNIFTFTLGPYGSAIEEVVQAIGTSLNQLDAGYIVTLATSERVILYTFLITFISNMP